MQTKCRKAFHRLMEPLFRLVCNLAVALFLFCAAYWQTVSAGLTQNPASSSAAPNSNPPQATIQIHGRVLDPYGAVVGGATVFFRSKVAGGCNGSNASPEFSAITNQFGEFSGTLRPGVYQAWVQRYHDCVEVAVTTNPGPITLKAIPELEIVDPSLPESRFQKVAGPGAIDCGRVGIRKDRTPATACAMHAYKHHKPFYVIYNEQGIDAAVADGVAWNVKDLPYSVEYDSMGLESDPPEPDTTMPDGSHTVVMRCSKPLRVYINEEGELDCFKNREMWEQRIANGDHETFLSAGQTGYRELIPALKKQLADPEEDDPEEREALGMALAKLGDRQEMQALVCELHNGSPLEMQKVAMDQDKIPYVGGWFAIRIYREMLTPAAQDRFDKARLREEGKLGFYEPQWWALASLLNVVPYPQPPGVEYAFNRTQMQENSKIWLDWIAKNKKRLRRLEPTGKGVDFSGRSCKPIGKSKPGI